MGIHLDEMPCRLGKYPPREKLLRPLWLAGALCEQGLGFAKSRKYDAVLLQREMISNLVTFERWVRAPTALDVDDAIFLFRGGYVAKRLAERAEVIVCGNEHLAERFSAWNPRVRIIPTAIDTNSYRPAARKTPVGHQIIGWIGTSSNLFELKAIERALMEVLSRFPTAKLRIVSDRPPDFAMLGAARVEYFRWREATEVAAIQSMDIGIMPLQDSAWARGKCSFKMIQYMACGLPSVVSAVGMNLQITKICDCSLAVRTDDEWVDALSTLLANPERRRVMGTMARGLAEKTFSVSALAPQLADAIQGVL